MRRRTLLGGTTGALCGLTGCVGSAFDDSTPDGAATERTGESRRTIVVGDLESVPFPAAHPPHELVLRNESDANRTVTVAVTTGEDTLLERDVTVSAGRSLEVVLAEPRSYAVTVTTAGSGGESSATVGVDREPFDCTRSSTTATLRGSGIGMRSVSESIACPDLRIVARSIEAVAQGCADERDDDSATVEFANEAVAVAGQITTPTPCYEPSIADATYDEADDALVLTVDSGEQSAAGCVDCLGVVDYEARIELEGRYPGRVVVHHASRSEAQRVATVAYPSDQSETERASG
ncbi:hypothetical protein [Natrinema sp. 74]|uniref:hypothetical protein n=1 Tax=Natrinema sp. 74 TaxID=3384159 RepID=UPI0038D4FF58